MCWDIFFLRCLSFTLNWVGFSMWLFCLILNNSCTVQEKKKTGPQILSLNQSETWGFNFGNTIFHTELRQTGISIFSASKTTVLEAGSKGRSTFMVDGWKMVLLQQILDQHKTKEWLRCTFVSVCSCICMRVVVYLNNWSCNLWILY